MDLRMPGGGGVAAIAELTGRGARSKVLVLTTYDTDSDTLPAIEAGATGYLLKDAPRDELFTAVRAAADGRTVLSPTVASRLISRVRTPAAAGSEALSGREREVLENRREGHLEPGDRRRTVHQRGDREDPSHPCLRQAGRQGPGRRRGDRLRPGHPRLTRPPAPAHSSTRSSSTDLGGTVSVASPGWTVPGAAVWSSREVSRTSS